MGNPSSNNFVRCHAGDICPEKFCLSFPWLEKPGDGPQRRGLSRTISPNQGYELSRTHVERYPLEDVNVAVISMDAFKT